MQAEWLGGSDPFVLARSTLVHPQPVAIASLRVQSAQNRRDLVEESLKAGEVLARYLGGLALASWAYRDDPRLVGVELSSKKLAFGDFLDIIRSVARKPSHPLTSRMDTLKEGKKGHAHAAINAILTTRNGFGHDLTAITAVEAELAMRKDNPARRYVTALELLEPLLQFPLFVPIQSVWERGWFGVTRILLMGHAGHHAVDRIVCDHGIDEAESPHVAADGNLLCLPPFLGWQLIEARHQYEICMLDGLGEFDAAYQTIYSTRVPHPGAAVNLRQVLQRGIGRPPQRILDAVGRPLETAWAAMASGLEQLARTMTGGVRWERLDGDALRWWADRADGEAGAAPRDVLKAQLLGGYEVVSEAERFELEIMFGTEATITELLQRRTVDLRDARAPDKRLDARVELTQCVISSLRQSVAFVVDRLKLTEVSESTMAKAEGNADYIAIREGLVNQFAHQDYRDQRAAAQVTLLPGKTVFFNAGYSLAGGDRLNEGFRSVQRNPLIARALKVIGWAESGATGLRRMYDTWERATRVPPAIYSDERANTFTLELTWDRVAGDVSAEWRDRLGVELTRMQAAVLEFIVDAGEPTATAIIRGCQISSAEYSSTVARLEVQGLVTATGGRYRASEAVQTVVRGDGQR